MSDLAHQTSQLLQQARLLLDKAKASRERAVSALRDKGIDNLPAYLETHASHLSAAQREQIEQTVRDVERESTQASQAMPPSPMDPSRPLTASPDTDPPVRPKRFRQMV